MPEDEEQQLSSWMLRLTFDNNALVDRKMAEKLREIKEKILAHIGSDKFHIIH